MPTKKSRWLRRGAKGLIAAIICGVVGWMVHDVRDVFGSIIIIVAAGICVAAILRSRSEFDDHPPLNPPTKPHDDD